MEKRTKRTGEHSAMPRWKQRLFRELIRYFLNVIYLAFIFGAFEWYRRAILASYEISYAHYGIAIIEGLVLAKIVWIGELLSIVKEKEGNALIYPTIHKAIIFTLFVALFGLVEHVIRGWFEGVGAIGGIRKLWIDDKFELLAKCVIIFCAFIPFFAFRELAREFGENKLWRLFFRRKEPPTEFGMPGATA